MTLAIAGDTQAGTATAGPIVFNDLPIVAQADIAEQDHAVNVTLISGKKKGSLLINATTGEIMVAQGSTPTSAWNNMGPVAANIVPA